MVYRVYVEKKAGLDQEARALFSELKTVLGIEGLTGLRLLNRYDVENIEESIFQKAVAAVFSEPQLDIVSFCAPQGTTIAVEYLPGQFDQRADSAAQCIQILSRAGRPTVRSARVYVLQGALSEQDIASVRRYLINPVEAREASMELPASLVMEYSLPEDVETLDGFSAMNSAELEQFIKQRGLAMDLADLCLCQKYYQDAGREPTITEIRVLDTYWSDHCRHTTFHTILDNVSLPDEQLLETWNLYLNTRRELGRETAPICLMDLGTLAAKALKKRGQLSGLDESEEINACTVKTTVTVDGQPQDWLLLFKNETHNHPTEIEPFGGAATCIGGAIRDPLSGRSYVYAAMRVTGAADPRTPLTETLPGKLPQRTIVTKAAAGYSSYGNQIGIATGQVDEVYHPGYEAKRMEVGAVIAAAPAENVRREEPAPGDLVILLGGRTGRDGMGGATGSSKAHTQQSLETCGAEVQKGNAPEERKLQRLFRNARASRMIKRCNDFGAGGVSVAVGELAGGLSINLDAVPKKYEGLDGTEIAISESQERMAVVIAPQNREEFIRLADEENLEATVIACVTEQPRLTMRWNGKTIVDLSRDFLDTNGAEKHAAADLAVPNEYKYEIPTAFSEGLKRLAADPGFASRRGLAERFDSTIGAGTVLMPFGGRYQLTPSQAMVTLISTQHGHTDDCSFMSWGFDPYLMEASPYHGAYLSVVSSICKLAASGAELRNTYLSFQEFFPRPGDDAKKWGLPAAALLGAFQAQMDLGIAAIGGKDSMSGSFEHLDVPPTLISFAVTAGKKDEVISPEFKASGHRVALIRPAVQKGLPDPSSLRACFALLRQTRPFAAWACGRGGIAEGIMNMCLGNGIGFRFADQISLSDIFMPCVGSFLIETDDEAVGLTLGYTVDEPAVAYGKETVALDRLKTVWSAVFEDIYPVKTESRGTTEAFTYNHAIRKAPSVHTAQPAAIIPVFPGTNCEYDTYKALTDAGAKAEIFVIRNRSAEDIVESTREFAKKLRQANIVVIPGGFSGGDEPDGSAKFIVSFFRNAAVTQSVRDLLQKRDGLICGICNGFQALVKLGLVTYGDIVETTSESPTLTCNVIGRHQSRIVRTRIASDLSPWFSLCRPGEIYSVPISHGEGRFFADEAIIRDMASRGQIAAQYVDLSGNPTMDVDFNPNGSVLAVEAVTSPDGRVLGKMGHTERWTPGLYQNVPGNYDMAVFRSAVSYFK